MVAILTLCLAFGAGCSQQSKSPDVTDNIKKSLEQAGLKDVKVDEDRSAGERERARWRSAGARPDRQLRTGSAEQVSTPVALLN